MTQIISRINVCLDSAMLNYMSSQGKDFFLTIANIKGSRICHFYLHMFTKLIKPLKIVFSNASHPVASTSQ